MDNRFSSAGQDPVSQAAEFFIEFRAGDATPAVRARFEKWLRSSPENVQAYLEIAAGWSELPTADPGARIDVEALLAGAQSGGQDNVIHLAFGQSPAPNPLLPHRVRVRAAVGCLALLLVVFAVTAIWTLLKPGVAYRTSVGEQRTLILADGSTVTLNALTAVRVLMTKKVREVTLISGQAYFHDENEPDRPFIVRTGQSTVRAIGTEFDIDREADQTVVTVLTGEVAVVQTSDLSDRIPRRALLVAPETQTERLRAVVVSAGEQVIVGSNIPPPTPVDVTSVTAWMQQHFIFNDTPLARVAQQFNRYSKRALVIADPSLRTVEISGEYSASHPDELIRFLRSQPSLRVVETESEFLVSRR